jgi:hypothetical protein
MSSFRLGRMALLVCREDCTCHRIRCSQGLSVPRHTQPLRPQLDTLLATGADAAWRRKVMGKLAAALSDCMQGKRLG